MGKFGLGLAALCLWPGLALADKLLSGEDAAYIDWSVNNCATKSTDKEHALVDQANAKDAAGFLRKYQSTNLGDALSTPSKRDAMCADIKGWYGPGGSRFPDLMGRYRSRHARFQQAGARDHGAQGSAAIQPVSPRRRRLKTPPCLRPSARASRAPRHWKQSPAPAPR